MKTLTGLNKTHSNLSLTSAKGGMVIKDEGMGKMSITPTLIHLSLQQQGSNGWVAFYKDQGLTFKLEDYHNQAKKALALVEKAGITAKLSLNKNTADLYYSYDRSVEKDHPLSLHTIGAKVYEILRKNNMSADLPYVYTQLPSNLIKLFKDTPKWVYDSSMLK
jgi:hypothetical protein